MTLLLFVIGFGVLLKSADWLIDGATSLAARMGVSELAIGLTVVSFGTSLPEMLVTQVSAFRGFTGLAIGNILGSNIANILLVLGIAAIVKPLPVKDSTVLSEIPFSISAALLVGFLANAALFTNNTHLSISQIDGLIMLFFFCLFLLYVYKISTDETSQLTTDVSRLTLGQSWVRILVGSAGLFLGGHWVVNGAIEFADHLGLSQSLVGLTLLAIGTSLPELVASTTAAYKGKADLAVGNVVGSNMFNLLWVLGLASAIRELPFNVITNTDLMMVIFCSTLLLLALVTPKRETIDRIDGYLFVFIYFWYLIFLFQRG